MAREGQRRVLIAVDGSDSADHAFEWYMKNMCQPNDYVYGITVPEYSFSGVTVGPLADPQALSDEFRQQHNEVEKLCADYTARLRSHNISGQVDAIPGDKPGPTICKQVESLHCDNVVMGTRGLSKLRKFLLGSVSTYVVNHAQCPVSVIPLHKNEQKEEECEQQKK